MSVDVSVVRMLDTPHQNLHVDAMLAGLSAIGLTGRRETSAQARFRSKWVACWGWRAGSVLRRRGYEVLVMEHGYIGDRRKYSSLGWNGLNNYAKLPDYPDDGGERFRRHGGVLLPWRSGGGYALVLGQVPRDMSLKGQNLAPWYKAQAQALKKTHGLKVYFRQHPVALKKRMPIATGLPELKGTLAEALAGAALTLCYNSNASVDSVLAGIPCIVGDKGTMAWDMCGHSPEEIITPEREVWAHRLAFKQWCIEEIASGAALERLFK